MNIFYENLEKNTIKFENNDINVIIDENDISNMEIHANINGWAAYKPVNVEKLSQRLKSFLPKINIHYTNVNEIFETQTPLAAHYEVANLNTIIK